MNKPLAGLKVLDLTRALSGPFCTMTLADLGAEVIKVEPTPNGDMIRQWGPFDEDISVYYLSANRNKKGIGVNFRSAEGLEFIKQLALKSDIVVENFKALGGRVGAEKKRIETDFSFFKIYFVSLQTTFFFARRHQHQ